jgi:hypothetical protein
MASCGTWYVTLPDMGNRNMNKTQGASKTTKQQNNKTTTGSLTGGQV